MERPLKYLIWLSLLACMGMNAFIYDICVMRKWDPAYRHYSYFVGLGDFHDKNHIVTPLQLEQITKLFRRSPSEKTRIIVEDISSKNIRGCKSCGRFYVKSKGGILGGLTNKCRKAGMKNVYNVEYRFCRVASLAPILNNIHKNAQLFPSCTRITIGCLNNEIVRLCRQICTYKDNHVIEKWYKSCVNKVARGLKCLKWENHLNMSVADYVCRCTNEKNRLDYIKKLLTFDSYLLDVQIVHSMMQARNKQNMIVIAGGSHIRNVSNLLHKLGYETLCKSKPTFIREYNIKKCPGCHVQPGGFCRKPKPADLKILQKFL